MSVVSIAKIVSELRKLAFKRAISMERNVKTIINMVSSRDCPISVFGSKPNPLFQFSEKRLKTRLVKNCILGLGTHFSCFICGNH